MRTLVPVVILALLASTAGAQASPGAAAAPVFTAETEHYQVTSAVSEAQAADLGKRMESILALANGIFHFDLARLPGKMAVRVFGDEAGFVESLRVVVAEEPQDFVLLSWTDPPHTELDCYTRDEPSFSSSLIHQGVIQIASTFVPQTPVWLREGVAEVLQASSWDAEAAAYVYRPNLAWLPSLRSILRGEGGATPVPLDALLRYSRDDARARLDLFYPEAWGLVYFLLTSPDLVHNRALWDALASLRPEASIAENEQAVDRAVSWIGANQLQRDFSSFALGLKDAAELLQDGIGWYEQGDLAQADESLRQASRLAPASPVIRYYLGLVAYARKDFPQAEASYQEALSLGAAAGPVNYALGVNSFAEGSYDRASTFLALARQADPAGLGPKADALVKRMEARQ